MEYVSIEYIFLISSLLFVASFVYNLKQRKIINELNTKESEFIENIFYDSVTDLPNRNNIEIIITEHINITSRRNKSFYMFAIKALDYKSINRTSKEKANELSCEITDAILSSIRDEDNVARVSDDEYIVVFNEYLEADNLQIPIDRIKEALKDVNISFASSSFPEDGDSTPSLINGALAKL
jgi:diguanylate cyclase (GGDEF)-like protein